MEFYQYENKNKNFVNKNLNISMNNEVNVLFLLGMMFNEKYQWVEIKYKIVKGIKKFDLCQLLRFFSIQILELVLEVLLFGFFGFVFWFIFFFY